MKTFSELCFNIYISYNGHIDYFHIQSSVISSKTFTQYIYPFKTKQQEETCYGVILTLRLSREVRNL